MSSYGGSTVTATQRRRLICLERCYRALLPGGRLAVLIGDVRKAGRYTPLIRDVLNFPAQIRAVIIKVQHNCKSEVGVA